jgi:hypothetical protein
MTHVKDGKANFIQGEPCWKVQEPLQLGYCSCGEIRLNFSKDKLGFLTKEDSVISG